MSRSARRSAAAVATFEVSPKQLLDAHRQGAIVLTKAERTAFRGPMAGTPVVLREDQKLGQQIKAWLASKTQHAAPAAPVKKTPKAGRRDWTAEALDALDAEGYEPDDDADLEAAVHQKIAQLKAAERNAAEEIELVEEKQPAKKAKRTDRPSAPVKTETNVRTEKAPKSKTVKGATQPEPTEVVVKRARKGEGKSRTPEARKARRILREYLRVSLVATDESEDAEIREIAAARAAHLEQLIGEAV